jgi:hypothetical protein
MGGRFTIGYTSVKAAQIGETGSDKIEKKRQYP